AASSSTPTPAASASAAAIPRMSRDSSWLVSLRRPTSMRRRAAPQTRRPCSRSPRSASQPIPRSRCGPRRRCSRVGTTPRAPARSSPAPAQPWTSRPCASAVPGSRRTHSTLSGATPRPASCSSGCRPNFPRTRACAAGWPVRTPTHPPTASRRRRLHGISLARAVRRRRDRPLDLRSAPPARDGQRTRQGARGVQEVDERGAAADAVRRARHRPRGEVTLVEHLDEVRYRLLVCGAAVMVGTTVAFVFHDPILALLLRPLPAQAGGLVALGGGHRIAVTAVGEAFAIVLKLSLAAGIALATP